MSRRQLLQHATALIAAGGLTGLVRPALAAAAPAVALTADQQTTFGTLARVVGTSAANELASTPEAVAARVDAFTRWYEGGDDTTREQLTALLEAIEATGVLDGATDEACVEQLRAGLNDLSSRWEERAVYGAALDLVARCDAPPPAAEASPDLPEPTLI